MEHLYKIDPTNPDSILKKQLDDWEQERAILINEKTKLEAQIAALGRQIDAVTRVITA